MRDWRMPDLLPKLYLFSVWFWELPRLLSIERGLLQVQWDLGSVPECDWSNMLSMFSVWMHSMRGLTQMRSLQHQLIVLFVDWFLVPLLRPLNKSFHWWYHFRLRGLLLILVRQLHESHSLQLMQWNGWLLSQWVWSSLLFMYSIKLHLLWISNEVQNMRRS